MDWISVKDRLPENADRVLVSQGEVDDVEIAYYFHGFGWKMLDSEWHNIYGVTHWMPLPKPPEDT